MFSTEWSKTFKGIRFRLTFVYSTLFGLFICVFAYILSVQHFQSVRDDFDSGLFNYGIDLSEHLSLDKKALKINFRLPESEDRKAFPFLLKQTYYMVRSFDGKILAQSHTELPFKEIPYQPNLPLKHEYTYRFLKFNSAQEIFRGINIKISDDTGEEMILQVATSFQPVLNRERNHIIITTFILPFLIIGSSFFAYLIAGNALAPIKTLTETANSIAAQNLSMRVPVVGTGDEVEELSKTLNNLLERLETSFKAQENFVGNASHQLNTPLSIIKGELDVLESKPRSKEEHTKFLESLREEIERLIDLVKKMLLVSRVESGLEKFDFTKIRLDDLLLTTSSRLRIKARENKVSVKFNIDESLSDTDLEVDGERQLLDTMFENLLENAIKYSPEKGTVTLTIKKDDGQTAVFIEDEGTGMEEKDFNVMLTKRFERGSGLGIPGTGIGLPLAHKIAEFHKARISYRKLSPGSLFIIRFT